MRPQLNRRPVLPALPALVALVLAGCSPLLPAPPAPPAVLDFGLTPPAAAPAGTPAAAQVTAAPWLDGTAMLYRLAYADAARLAVYRDSRWAAPPAALVQERLRQQLARSPQAAAATALHVEIEEFCQVFDGPAASRGVVRLRVALVDRASGRVLRQLPLAEEKSAGSADAAGGARALVQALDAALSRALAWAASPA